MQATGIAPLVISALALGLSFYGVAERLRATWRAERLRVAAIVDELNSLRLEHPQPTTNLQHDDLSYLVNARAEVLAMQAQSLTKKWMVRRSISSPEYRTLAFALSRAGYPREAEQSWHGAVRAARREGVTALLYAHRGLAYFLFGEGRLGEGRTEMAASLDAIGSADDTDRIHQIKTLKYWSNAERRANEAGPEATELVKQAEAVLALLGTEAARQQMREFLARSGTDE